MARCAGTAARDAITANSRRQAFEESASCNRKSSCPANHSFAMRLLIVAVRLPIHQLAATVVLNDRGTSLIHSGEPRCALASQSSQRGRIVRRNLRGDTLSSERHRARMVLDVPDSDLLYS